MTPIKFLLAWLVPAWIVFELIITKLPHYVLPLYPAIAILLAMAIDSALSRQKWMEYGTFWWFAVPVLVLRRLAGSAVALRRQSWLAGWPFLGRRWCSASARGGSISSTAPERSMLRAAVTSVLLAIAVYWSVLPSLAMLFPECCDRAGGSRVRLRGSQGRIGRLSTSRVWCFSSAPRRC